MIPHRPRKHPAAFTLVELLVVIGIIAVLIGVLLPALSAARKQAATTKCLSSLRSIGQAFQLYANHYRDAYPVVRQDTPDDGGFPPNGTGPQNVQNTYYTDMLMPFVSKTGKMNFQLSTNDILAFKAARESVMWGCPEWEGWPGTGANTIDGIYKYDSGYAMNFFPTFQANYPASATARPPGKETQMRWSGTSFIGRYYRRAQWTRPSERLLMSDSYFWLLDFYPTSGAIRQQYADRVYPPPTTGDIYIDRFRHGKKPRIVTFGGQRVFANSGGKQAFNVLFADGHASTLFDIREGYKAIRMRYPGP